MKPNKKEYWMKCEDEGWMCKGILEKNEVKEQAERVVCCACLKYFLSVPFNQPSSHNSSLLSYFLFLSTNSREFLMGRRQ